VCPTKGANLCSVQFKRPDGSWLETIHRANDFTSPPGDDWEGKSPVLWPAVGRNFTAAQLEEAAKSGERPSTCRYGENSLEIPLHGFAQNTNWSVSKTTASEEEGATVVLEATPEDAPEQNQEWYPYQWKLTMILRVTGSDLSVQINVDNLGDVTMPFSVGTHPTFKLPFVPGKDIGDTALSWGSHTIDLALTPFSCLSGESKDHSEDGSLPASIFCDNVLGMKEKDGLSYMDLISPKEGLGIRVKQKLMGDINETNLNVPLYFVNWADSKQGFFCMEPWCGGPNSLNGNNTAIQLDAGKTFQWKQELELLSFEVAE
jgi:galactose mutarotase-like enzyme